MVIEEHTETKFNAALASLQRLHILLVEANHYSRAARQDSYDVNMLSRWDDTIAAIFREISPKLTEKEIKKYYEVKQQGKNAPVLYERAHDEEAESQRAVVVVEGFLWRWNFLDKLEILLRKFADSKGMLIPNKMSSGEAIADME